MAPLRTVHKVCQHCGKQQVRRDGVWLWVNFCNCQRVPGPQAPPVKYHEQNVILVQDVPHGPDVLTGSGIVGPDGTCTIIMPQCIYVPAYAPRCANPARPGMQTCEEHGQTCYGCGERPATHGCTDGGGQFVCGAPICDSCTHNTRGGGHGPAVMA